MSIDDEIRRHLSELGGRDDNPLLARGQHPLAPAGSDGYPTALHEGAHGCVGELCGLQCTGLSLRRTLAGYDGAMRYTNVTDTLMALATALAGDQYELFAGYAPAGSADDRAKVSKMLHELCADSGERLLLKQGLCNVLRHAFEDLSPAVEAVARSLWQRGELSGYEVWSLLNNRLGDAYAKVSHELRHSVRFAFAKAVGFDPAAAPVKVAKPRLLMKLGTLQQFKNELGMKSRHHTKAADSGTEVLLSHREACRGCFGPDKSRRTPLYSRIFWDGQRNSHVGVLAS